MTEALITAELNLVQLARALQAALAAAEDVDGREPPVTIEQSQATEGDRLRLEAYIAQEKLRLQGPAAAVKTAFENMGRSLQQLTDLTEDELLQRIAALEAEELRLDEEFLKQYGEACLLSDEIDKQLNEVALKALR